MKKYFDSILDRQGKPVPGVSVSVFNAGTSVKAVIFSDDGATVSPNPVMTDSLGYFAFYAEDGKYKLIIARDGIAMRTIDDVLIYDPTDDLPSTAPTTVTPKSSYGTALADQTLIPVPTYAVGVNCLDVYINGAKLPRSGFTETDSVSITLAAPLSAGDLWDVTNVGISREFIHNNPPEVIPDPTPPEPPSVLPYGRPAEEFGALTFRDEFNGTAINTAAWNNRLWYEADNGKNNIDVLDGRLRMWMTTPFVKTNATLDTDGKFYQKYGYFEIKARLPGGKGAWPAFWLYNHDGSQRPEIDIMEAYPGGGPETGWGTASLQPNNYAASVHPKIEGNPVIGSNKLSDFLGLQDLTVDHYYGCKWDAAGVTFYFDGVQMGPKVATAEMDSRMYILLDLWTGSASGVPDASTPVGPSNSFSVDYVRAWALANGSTVVETALPAP